MAIFAKGECQSYLLLVGPMKDILKHSVMGFSNFFYHLPAKYDHFLH